MARLSHENQENGGGFRTGEGGGVVSFPDRIFRARRTVKSSLGTRLGGGVSGHAADFLLFSHGEHEGGVGVWNYHNLDQLQKVRGVSGNPLRAHSQCVANNSLRKRSIVYGDIYADLLTA